MKELKRGYTLTKPTRSAKTKTRWSGVPDDVSKFAGFVYLITNKITGQKYVGKKFFWRSLRQKVRGSSRRKKVVKESDWSYYKSSSKKVLEDIDYFGEDKFSFDILRCLDTRAGVNEAEVQEQFARDVLHARLANGEYEYYNESILSKFYRPKPEGTKEYLDKCRAQSRAQKLRSSDPNYVHPMKGKIHPSRGKKLPQCGHYQTKGKVRWTDGVHNIVLDKEEPPPPGYRRGVSTKKRGHSKAHVDYVKNPKLCRLCGTPIPFAKRNLAVYCSRACMDVGKVRPKWEGGTNPSQRWAYRTPAGTFTSSIEAGKALGVSDVTVRNRCKANIDGFSLLTIDEWRNYEKD